MKYNNYIENILLQNKDIITHNSINIDITGYVNINLIGGLCNQIFQIVNGYVLCLRYNKQLIRLDFLAIL